MIDRLIIADPALPFARDNSGKAKVRDICVTHVASAGCYVIGEVLSIDSAGNAIEVDAGVYNITPGNNGRAVFPRVAFGPLVHTAFGPVEGGITEVEARLRPHLTPDAARAAGLN